MFAYKFGNWSICTLVAVAFFSHGASVLAGEREDRELDRNIQQLREFSKQEQAREDREKMRDKSHDGFRRKTGPDTSIGIDENGASIRRTYK